MARALSLLLFCTAACAQTGAPLRERPASSQTRPEDKCRITGTVLDFTDGSAVRKAQIVLIPAKDRRTPVLESLSDAAGKYEIDGIDPGQYRLVANRNGFLSQTYGSKGAQRGGEVVINLSPGQTLAALDFKLKPHGVLVGKVVAEDEEPVEGALVLCLRDGYAGGQRRLMPVGNATTNDLGEYRIFGLPPGKCYIKASRSPLSDSEPAPVPNGKPEEEFAPAFYPNAPSIESASQIAVNSGGVVQDVTLTLRKTRTYRIRGNVLSAATGKPVRDAQITLLPNTPDPLSYSEERDAQVQDSKGNWEFQGVEPGSYLLIGERDATEREAARKPIEVGNKNVEKVELTLHPGIELKGRVLSEGNVDRKVAPLFIRLRPKDPTGFGFSGASGQVNEDGAFKLPGVTQDSYSVLIAGLPADWYVKSVRYGPTDITYAALDFTEGLIDEELTVTLSAAGGQLDGLVQDADQQPAPGATVVLIPSASRRDQTQLFKTANTDQAGHYSLKGIAPGDYKAFAWESVERSAYQDPEFLKPYESSGEAVSIEEGGHVNKSLRLIPLTTQDGQT